MRAFNTITKEELIDTLDNLPDGAEIAFATDYGDHTHTMQVHGIRGRVEEKTLTESAYSDSGWAILDDEEEVIEGDKTQTVFILE